MILRRLTNAFRKQDWFTVAVEIMIVVLGVFIGLQVNNWNEARKERTAEKRVIERLRDEVPELIGLRSEQRKFADFRLKALDSASRKLFIEASGQVITPPECLSMTLSHIYLSPSNDLPVIEELVSTGSIDVIQKPRLKVAVQTYLQAKAESEETLRAISIDIHQISLEFPELILSTYYFEAPDADPESRQTCNSSGMRADGGFLNTLISNHQRFLTYYQSQFETIDPKLDALVDALGALK